MLIFWEERNRFRKRVMLKYIPNCITSIRIIGTLILIFTNTFTTDFYVIYTICGLSDVLDGLLARATKNSTEFGAKLDSFADLMFYLTMFMKIMPELIAHLPILLWCVAFTVIGVRLAIYAFVAIKHRVFAAVHTYMNKLTGLTIFAIPYFMLKWDLVIACAIVAVTSSLATLEELMIHLFAKRYDTSCKSIFLLKKCNATVQEAEG